MSFYIARVDAKPGEPKFYRETRLGVTIWDPRMSRHTARTYRDVAEHVAQQLHEFSGDTIAVVDEANHAQVAVFRTLDVLDELQGAPPSPC